MNRFLIEHYKDVYFYFENITQVTNIDKKLSRIQHKKDKIIEDILITNMFL
jgi:hypothetical protein